MQYKRDSHRRSTGTLHRFFCKCDIVNLNSEYVNPEPQAEGFVDF